MFCEDLLDVPSIDIGIRQIGILRLIIGVLYIFMMNVTIWWIYIQKKKGEQGDYIAVNAVVFPLFLNIMWLSALSDAYVGILIVFVPAQFGRDNSLMAQILYPLAYAFQHAVLEGVALLLMQKGCGYFASKRASFLTMAYFLFTFLSLFLFYAHIPFVSSTVFVLWSLALILFYLLLWMLPSHLLFRRESAVPYARFWCLYRLVVFICTATIVVGSRGQDAAQCGYMFTGLLFYACVHPVILYKTLLHDSRWWQGLRGSVEGSVVRRGEMTAPLMGVDLSMHSAQILARMVDVIGEKRSARLLNFAHIYLDKQHVLGYGSFSKVYRGTYMAQSCAIKLIYTTDLTEEVISRALAEATILSAVCSPHVVTILGVSVLPPSVCLVLELCAFGSLSDVLRGDSPAGSMSKRGPLTLSDADKIYLAIGCTRGVAALHRLGPEVVHRDIKSYNFLVDSQLNAKLADLELGLASDEKKCTDRDYTAGTLLEPPNRKGSVVRGAGCGDGEDDVVAGVAEEGLFQRGFLQNWLAPEIMRGGGYTQAADVYSLSLVLWEILTAEIPYQYQQHDLHQHYQQHQQNPYNQHHQSADWPDDRRGQHHISLPYSPPAPAHYTGASARPLSIRQLVLSGHRPPLPSTCHSKYASLVCVGWAADPSDRPRAHEIEVALVDVWRACMSPQLNTIEDTSDISSTIDEFLASPEGQRFGTQSPPLQPMTQTQHHHQNQPPNSRLRTDTADSGGSRWEGGHGGSSVDPMRHLSPQGTPQRKWIMHSASSDTPADGTGHVATRNQIHFSSDLSTASGAADSTSRPSVCGSSSRGGEDAVPEALQFLHVAVKRSVVWSIIAGLEDPVGIICAQAPHFFLKSSLNFTSLFGYAPEQVFGRTLAHLLWQDEENDDHHHHQSSPEHVSSGDSRTHPQARLTHFYRQLQNMSHSPISTPTMPVHVVLPLVCADGKVLSEVSVHAFPILRKPVRSVARGPPGAYQSTPPTECDGDVDRHTLDSGSLTDIAGTAAHLDVLTSRYTANPSGADGLEAGGDKAAGLNHIHTNRSYSQTHAATGQYSSSSSAATTNLSPALHTSLSTGSHNVSSSSSTAMNSYSITTLGGNISGKTASNGNGPGKISPSGNVLGKIPSNGNAPGKIAFFALYFRHLTPLPPSSLHKGRDRGLSTRSLSSSSYHALRFLSGTSSGTLGLGDRGGGGKTGSMSSFWRSSWFSASSTGFVEDSSTPHTPSTTTTAINPLVTGAERFSGGENCDGCCAAAGTTSSRVQSLGGGVDGSCVVGKKPSCVDEL